MGSPTVPQEDIGRPVLEAHELLREGCYTLRLARPEAEGCPGGRVRRSKRKGNDGSNEDCPNVWVGPECTHWMGKVDVDGHCVIYHVPGSI